MTVTISHNPARGTSRNVLAMIQASGEAPVVIEYLKTPPSRETLVGLLEAMGARPRDFGAVQPRPRLQNEDARARIDQLVGDQRLAADNGDNPNWERQSMMSDDRANDEINPRDSMRSCSASV